MRVVFKNAMTFETYAQIWRDTLQHINLQLRQTENSILEAEGNLADISLNLYTVDDDYAQHIKIRKKERRKRLAIVFGIPAFIVIFLIIALLSRNLYLLYLLSYLVFGILPILLIGIIVYNVFKLKAGQKDIKNHSTEALEQSKLVARNNINAYNLFLQKQERQKTMLIEKKQFVSDNLQKAEKTLREIYADYLISEEYRGLIATTAIYGYLKSGRCTVMSGGDGVYNTFIKDQQQNQIISNLKELNVKANTIINQNRTLIGQLESIDSTLSNIKIEVNHLGETASRIEHNSSIAATAAAQSAAANSYIASAVWRNT